MAAHDAVESMPIFRGIRTHVATKTIQSTVSPFEQMKLVQDRVLRSDGPD